MNDDNSDLLNKATIGMDAETFLGTNLGRKLVERAAAHADEATEKLKKCSPIDAAMIRDLQNEIWKAESFKDWIAEIIQEGWNAEQELSGSQID